MPLSIGGKLGPYEILAPIGAGGMGEVYRARDTKLKRDVAIKVLPEALARDPARMARFQREAEVLASLNHPNIAAIYGVEDRALVMEMVEGDSPQGPLPFDDAWHIASQIADALEYAHDKGVVHRDLKPANIKITPEGVVKLLDFGLAKAFTNQREARTSASDSPENSPTLTIGATEVGMILGTAAYMAPEQARGKEVDKRADIWSFGVVLYELLTGERLFAGEEVADTLAQVLTKEPDLERAPASMRALLRECLQRDPRQRLRDIGDAKKFVEVAASFQQAAAEQPAHSHSRFSYIGWATAGLLAVTLAGASLIAYRATRPVERPLMRFTDDLGAEISLTGQQGPAVAISPDGTRLAYVSQGEDNKTHLSVRLLENSKSTVLAGTEGADAPFFSPDGRWIGFVAANAMKKIAVAGGAPVTLCEIGGASRGGGFWSEDGNIFFAGMRTPVMRVAASGGTPIAVTELDKKQNEVSNRSAQFLPGGEAFLFDAASDNNVWDDATIQVQSVKSGQRKTLVEGGYFGHYIHGNDPAAGHLIYLHQGTLFAAPMDLKRLELTGPAAPVLEDVASRSVNGFAQLAVTVSGTLAYIGGSDNTSQQSLFWLDTAGNTQALPAAPGKYTGSLRISPDGTRFLVHIIDGTGANLSVYEWAKNRMTKLTFWKGIALLPTAWAPDGKHIVFVLASQELSGPGVYWIRSDGAGEPQRLIEGQNVVPYSFSPDGKRLAYTRKGSDYGVWTLPLDLTDPEHPKAGKPELFLASKADLRYPAFSPDGRWIAYASFESGPSRVFVRPFPGPGGKFQVSTGEAASPLWSRSGRELLYSGEEMMVVPYSVNGDSFIAGRPRPWSQKTFRVPSGPGRPDLTPDGRHLSVVMPTSDATARGPTHVTFLLNFADELRRKAPTGK